MKDLKQDYQLALDWVKSKQENFLAELGQLVAINSVSVRQEGQHPFGESCAEVLDLALALAAKLGFEVENHSYYCGSVLLRGNGSKKGEIGIIGHLDIVPEGGGWNYSPFEVTLENGYLIGRGVSDDKGPCWSGLYAMYYLKEHGIVLDRDIRLILGCNEEDGMLDIEYYNQNFAPPAFTFTPDCNFPVCNTEKGIMSWDMSASIEGSNLVDFKCGIANNVVPNFASATISGITLQEAEAAVKKAGVALKASAAGDMAGLVQFEAEGIGAHAARPEGSLNAAWKLADGLLKTGLADEKAGEALRFLAGHFGDWYGESFHIACEDEISGKLTHIGGLTRVENGMITQNMNIRYPVSADQDAMQAAIHAECGRCGFTAVMVENNKPSHTPADTPEIQLLLEICKDALDLNLPTYSMGGGTYARKLPNAVGFGPGMPGESSPFGPERGGAHQPDEAVRLEVLLQAAAVYAVSLKNLDKAIAD